MTVLFFLWGHLTGLLLVFYIIINQSHFFPVPAEIGDMAQQVPICPVSPSLSLMVFWCYHRCRSRFIGGLMGIWPDPIWLIWFIFWRQEDGWPLGLQPVNLRVGLVRNRNLSGSVSFSTLLTASPTNTDSSSDLDTEVSSIFIIIFIFIYLVLGLCLILESRLQWIVLW